MTVSLVLNNYKSVLHIIYALIYIVIILCMNKVCTLLIHLVDTIIGLSYMLLIVIVCINTWN